jgi:hypothetical protein
MRAESPVKHPKLKFSVIGYASVILESVLRSRSHLNRELAYSYCSAPLDPHLKRQCREVETQALWQVDTKLQIHNDDQESDHNSEQWPRKQLIFNSDPATSYVFHASELINVGPSSRN